MTHREAVVLCVLVLGAACTTRDADTLEGSVAMLERALGDDQHVAVLDGLGELDLDPGNPIEPGISLRLARLRLVAEAGSGDAEATLAALVAYEGLTAQRAPADLHARLLLLLRAAGEPPGDLLTRASAAYPELATSYEDLVLGGPARLPARVSSESAPDDIVDWRDRYPAHCTLHDLQTEDDVVTMRCNTIRTWSEAEAGLDPGVQAAARAELFPQANLYAGYDYHHSAAIVRYCSTCRVSERIWWAQHARPGFGGR